MAIPSNAPNSAANEADRRGSGRRAKVAGRILRAERARRSTTASGAPVGARFSARIASIRSRCAMTSPGARRRGARSSSSINAGPSPLSKRRAIFADCFASNAPAMLCQRCS